MDITTQSFLVLGVSKSGFAAADYLLKNNAECYFFEELSSPKIENSIKELEVLGGKRLSREQVLSNLNNIDVIILSPGIPINYDLAVEGKKLKKRIIGELEFAYLQFNPNIIAVTGTNGKTTTVSLLKEIFDTAGRNNVLVGNIGVPVSGKIGEINKDTVCITEVSSFQLEGVSAFCPHVSCVLNISPDHLERHYNMENYVYLKKRIFKNQKESEYCVLNYDDNTVKDFAKELTAKPVFVSVKERVEGAYCLEDKLYYKDEFITDKNSLALTGIHNLYDCLFSIAVAKIYKLNNGDIVNALHGFKGVKHRMEIVAEKNGVKFVNDSKATNTASTISALECLDRPTVLILGGSEKGETYENLFEKISQSMVKHVILTGASRYNMLKYAQNLKTEISITQDFTHAVKVATMFAESGDEVLLSPACASFDSFSNFEERGDTFRKIVESL